MVRGVVQLKEFDMLYHAENIGWSHYCYSEDGERLIFLGIDEDTAAAAILEQPHYVPGEPFDTIFAPVKRFSFTETN